MYGPVRTISRPALYAGADPENSGSTKRQQPAFRRDDDRKLNGRNPRLRKGALLHLISHRRIDARRARRLARERPGESTDGDAVRRNIAAGDSEGLLSGVADKFWDAGLHAQVRIPAGAQPGQRGAPAV